VFREGDDLHICLRQSFDYVLIQRAAQLAERVAEIDTEKALQDLLPLAQNYLASNVRERIEAARHSALGTQHLLVGASSEQRFRIRRPLGILTGTIDKLLICPVDDDGVDVEIIDFKTNRFRVNAKHPPASADKEAQLSFGFLGGASESGPKLDVGDEINAAAADYQIQMQAYALAVRELLPGARSIRITLHFLHPNVEVTLEQHLIERDLCARAIDETMLSIVSSSNPESFPAQPGERCRRCSFLELCSSGRRWVSEASEG
jgi:ATP-dependent exoDNAse (exonuclease V) beta subunit